MGGRSLENRKTGLLMDEHGGGFVVRANGDVAG